MGTILVQHERTCVGDLANLNMTPDIAEHVTGFFFYYYFFLFCFIFLFLPLLLFLIPFPGVFALYNIVICLLSVYKSQYCFVTNIFHMCTCNV